MDENLQYYKSELKKCRKEHIAIEMKIELTRQLKNKASFVLNIAKNEMDDLKNELNVIHDSYVESMKEATYANRLNEAISKRIKELTSQLDALKAELTYLKTQKDENERKLTEANWTIKVEEKRNAALLKKLNKRREKANLSPDLKYKIDLSIDALKMIKSETI